MHKEKVISFTDEIKERFFYKVRLLKTYKLQRLTFPNLYVNRFY
jgi:hypothetical protein